MFYVDLLVPQTFQENEKRVCLYLDYTNRHYLKLSSNFFPFTSLSLSTGCPPSFLHISLIIYYRTAIWSDPFSCVTLSRLSWSVFKVCFDPYKFFIHDLEPLKNFRSADFCIAYMNFLFWLHTHPLEAVQIFLPSTSRDYRLYSFSTSNVGSWNVRNGWLMN